MAERGSPGKHDAERRLGRTGTGIAHAVRQAITGVDQSEVEWKTILAEYAARDHRGLLVIGQWRVVLALNPAARSLLRYEGPIPQPVTQVVRDVGFGFAVGDVFHDGRELWHEAYAPAPDRLLRFHLLPIADAHRITVAVVVSIDDITRLRQLETVRRDFVANVSHELRTPIASINLLVETLQNGALRDEAVSAHFLERVRVEVAAMGRLVEELLELSRLESGGLGLELERVEVHDALEGVVSRLAPLAGERGVAVRLEVQEDMPRVMADSRRLEQILVNLVHNGIKFTPADGQVVLRARRQGHGVQIEIADSGRGMDPAEARRVFERFYKIDRARQRDEGAGLGLAIARHLVELHGSRLEVVSQVGRGSRFIFSLSIDEH